MIELVIAIFIGMCLVAGLMTKVSWLLSMSKAKREGAMLAKGKIALDSYLKNYGVSLATNGTAGSFINPFTPSFQDLKTANFLPTYMPAKTAFDGSWKFYVVKGPKNDLLGFVCDTQTITARGVASPALAGEVMLAAGGAGLRTSIANPGILTGPGYPGGIASPLIPSTPVTVCAWSYLPNPT